MASMVPSFRPSTIAARLLSLLQRRRHLGKAAVVADIVVGQREMVRGHLAGDRQARPLGAAHRLQRAGGGDVGDVVAPARERHQADVALDHHDLRFVGDARQAEAGRDLALGHAAAAGEREVLGMLAHDQAEGAGVAQRAPHHLAVRHRPAVVGEGHGPGLGEHPHLGELPPLQAAGDGAIGVDLDALGLTRAPLHELDQRHVVDHRPGVGHAGDACHPAGRRREAAGGDGLLVLVARLAEMHMHVDQAGAEAVAAAIDHGSSLRHAVGEERRPEIGDRALRHQERTGAVEAALRVQQAGVDVSRGRGG